MPPSDSHLYYEALCKNQRRGKRVGIYKLENELKREMDHLKLILDHIDSQKSKLKTEEAVLLAMLGNNSDITSEETSSPLCFTDLNMESGLNLIGMSTAANNDISVESMNSFVVPEVHSASYQNSPRSYDIRSSEPCGLYSPTMPIFDVPEVPEFSSLELPDVGSSNLFDLQGEHINHKSIDLDIANALSILENMSDCEAEDVEQNAHSPQSTQSIEESWKDPTQQSSTYSSDGDHEIG
ncbi:23124_t:CDS:2 [Dentiscutata erythropus]|uniref:23124_t:CDS:1 n=1 Tax=Dentiscutata erythropus TaxID=1348616 RepID=A0A9N9F5M7_9GLOM|nr:23124_t:CDS:2 [Dentiscutata erythropus]